MVVLSTWIPRSYTHLREAFSHLDSTGFELKNVNFEDNLTFHIKNITDGIDADFILTPVGVYTLVFDIPDSKDKENVIAELEEVILERLIKAWHSVTYKQVKNSVIPLRFSAFHFIGSTNKEPAAGLVRYFLDKYSPKDLYLYQAEQFISIQLAVIDAYILKMSEYYHKADEILSSLKGEFELSELKHTVFEMDYIEKNTGEVMSRIKDSLDCLEREKELVSKFNDTEDINEKLNRLETDLKYADRLWIQMDTMLDNLDNASNARLSFQETVESRRIEWFLSVEAASVIATLLLSIFVSEFTGLNAVVLSVAFLFVWAVIFLIMKKIRAK